MSAAIGLTGLAMLAAGIACSGGDDKQQLTAAPTPEPTATATATATNTATATPTSTPTATPTPFNGKVARMKIPNLKVDAPIEELAVNSRNEMETPRDTNRSVGWYYIWDRPGWGGNAVFSAHVYYHSIPAPFQKLAASKAGDEISVVMDNGAEYQYRVISNKRYHRDTIPMGDIIWPKEKPKESEWITLITCGGELDSTGQEYVSRDVIVAERVRG
jgi:sortase (surface protein transpeptidase)